MVTFSFIDVLNRLEAMGLSDVILPFIIIFAIMFAVLANIQIFGARRKNVNMIVAMGIALLVVVPHITGGYPPGGDLVEIMNSAIPGVSIIVVALVMALILIGIFGIRIDLLQSNTVGGIVILAAAGVVFLVFGNSAGWFSYNLPPALQFLRDPNIIAVGLVILVFIVIVGFITDDGQGNRWKGLFTELGKVLK
jgi:hypothetical protein